MKNLLFAALLLITACQASNQSPAPLQQEVTLYYDRLWQLTTKELAMYRRSATLNNKQQFHGAVSDYYATGTRQMQGVYLNGRKEGLFNFYYPSGALQAVGTYQHNARLGIWTFYHENGRIRDKIYFADQFVAALEQYDEQGNALLNQGTGHWEYTYVNDFDQSLKTVKGDYQDTLRHGSWKYYTKRLSDTTSQPPRLEYMEVFEHGAFVEGAYYWKNGTVETLSSPFVNILPEIAKFKTTEQLTYSQYASIEAYPFFSFLPPVDSSVFPLDQLARFAGSDDALRSYFRKSIKIPNHYRIAREHRSVAYDILIDETGRCILKPDQDQRELASTSDNHLFYIEARKSLKNMPLWEPAIRNGKKVKNHFLLIVSLDYGLVEVYPVSRNEVKNL